MVTVTEDAFGAAENPFTKKKETIRRFTMTNTQKMSVQVITYGATITTLNVPDANGKVEDITLGYDDIAGYLSATNPYFGGTIGRVTSRIGNGKFMLGGKEIVVCRNFLGKHQLHGGILGFDKSIWNVLSTRPDGVVFQFISPDGHQGHPGEVTATVTYTLADDNSFAFCMEATTTQPTPVNMTNHAYFNLAGHASGKKCMSEHNVQIKADKVTDTDEDTVPNGKIIDLNCHELDLREWTNVGKGLEKISSIAKGYDHNYVLDWNKSGLTTQAKAIHPGTGRSMEISSNQPCMHFYTAHNMPDVSKGETATIIGKGGAKYEKHGSFCMESHWYPDAVNHKIFPPIILSPGKKYNHLCLFKFGITNKNKLVKACSLLLPAILSINNYGIFNQNL